MAFKHPTCGGRHNTINEARDCDAQTKAAVDYAARTPGRDVAGQPVDWAQPKQTAPAHRTDSPQEFYGRRPSDAAIERSAILRSLAKQHENHPRITPRDLDESDVHRDSERMEQLARSDARAEGNADQGTGPWNTYPDAPRERDVRQTNRPAVVTEDGIYHDSSTGRIFKVVFNRASGDGRRLYAKQLVVHTDDGDVMTRILDLAPEVAKGSNFSWDYMPGGMRAIRSEWKMSEADATRFGKLYGRCFKCHRALTKEESIARSMGDICAGKQGF